MGTKKTFDAGSPGFWMTLITAGLSAAATGGIEFAIPVGEIANQLVTTFNSSGIYAVLGIVVVNIAGPVYNFMRKKIPFNWRAIWASTTTWIGVGSIAVAGLVMWGFQIPENTPSEIASAIVARNWALLGALGAANLIVPFVRWIKEKQKKTLPAG